MTTANAQVKAKIEKYLIDCIDSEGYDKELLTDKEKVTFVAECFKNEYCYEQNIQRYKTVQEVLRQWLMGSPSSFNVDFENYKILEVAKTFGNLPEKLTEKEEDKIINNWFSFMANKTLQLFRKHGIYVTYFLS